MPDSLLRYRTLFVFAAFAVAGCKDSVGTLQPTGLAQDQGAAGDGTAGTVLVTPPTFTVKDQNGNALGGVSVTLVVTAGGGTLVDPPTSSKNGPTPVGTWRLGNIAGLNSITVTAGSLPPLIISINGKAGAPANIVFVTGANQTAPAGSTLSVSPVAQVRDQFGNAVPGIPVSFTVVEGEGTLSSPNTVTSDASGNAASPSWTLGKSAVRQSVRAAAGQIAANVSEIIATDYAIDLRFFGDPMPDNTAAMFEAAAARIRGAVVGDVPDIQFPVVNLESDCRVPGLPTAFTEFVDDVIIYASFGPIDGPSKILAFSFPCYVRLPSQQTLIGVMKFDSDDLDAMIARGNLTDVIQHEMLHVVGIGTLWGRLGLLSGAGTSFSRYTGTFGVGGCVTLGGTPVCPGSVPVENTGGAGTADAHWRDAVFFNELMTGFVNSRVTVPIGIMNPLSVMSIQSLADVGYTVNPLAADPFAIPGLSASRASAQLNVDVPQSPWERVDHPLFELSKTGTVKRIIVQ
ncbi:MAG TPA: leishmanolysin-related zinc metalloendopeptidase [Gemmatimonadaceae bacterium]|nr:leishmanolysin-related zinc metalloendopeptidase [Gemmatimonadaceae bacterium]